MHIQSFQALRFAVDCRQRRSVALMAAVLAASLSGHAWADEYLDPIGGPGGGKFQVLCPGGQLLIGFDLRVADDVDAMRPVCATAYGPNVVDDVSQGNWYGGTGGRFHAAICPSDRPIVYGLSVRAEGVDTIIVNTIALDCGLAAETQLAKQDPNRSDPGFSGPSYMPASQTRIWLGYGIGGGGKRATGLGDRQHCPIGQVAVGVHGRSGIWLDAIGLICGEPRMAGNGHAPPSPLPKKNIAEQATKTGLTPASKTAAASVGIARRSTQASRSTAVGIMSAGQVSSPAVPAPPVVVPNVPQPVVFNPPLLEDNAQLWACADTTARDVDAGLCSGIESAQAYCQLRGAQSGPDLIIADARPGLTVRAVNGDVCQDANVCRVVSQLQCDR